ncbi:hypothetical protein [Nocardioides nanhaiensis]|uniref:hypothetical protein n=1 Tax=Nocardioides nanhaiensis TaxID=1476871 RepID=UPI0031EB4EA4
MHGTAPLPPTVRAAGSHTVGLIVTDNTEGGVSGGHQQLRANLERLWALAAPLGRLPELRYYPTGDAYYRTVAARLLAAVEPEMFDPFTAELVLPFDLPTVFWRDADARENVSTSTSSWSITNAANLAGTTGSITDPVFMVPGPVASVVVTDATTGRSVRWSGATIPSGSSLRIEPGILAAYRVTGTAWTGGTDVSGGLSVGPNGFDLNPNTNQRIGWTLTRTGGAGVNTCRARRAFL